MQSGPVFSYKLRHIVGFWLVETALSTNQKPTIYRNLYENTAPGLFNLVSFGQSALREISTPDHSVPVVVDTL